MTTIYDFIAEERVKYAKDIILEEGWPWSMKKHLMRSFLYLNSQFEDHNDDRDLRPNKNIVLPILNVQIRTEGFDVKDIELYVDDKDENFKSFLIKKFHYVWALKNQIDTFIDEMVTCYCIYGGVLVKNTGDAKPEVINLKSIEFCNQTNILDYPFSIKHKYGFAELETVNPKWDKDAIDMIIEIAKKEEKDYVEVSEIHGLMPTTWLDDNMEGDPEDEYTRQIQIVSDYKDENENVIGITLFSNKEPKLPFKFLSRDKIDDRALGRGGVEELFEAQIWTNWDEIKITEMLEGASKQIGVTDDPAIAAKHPSGLKDLASWELLEAKSSPSGRGVWQMDTYPKNLVVFNDSVLRWQEHAQILGSASDPLLGETPTSGTPFKLFEAQQIESKSMHRYRQGQIATFTDEIYRDWVLPHLAKELVKDQSFLAELSFDEFKEVSEQIAENRANAKRNEQVLNGEIPEDKEMLKEQAVLDFTRGGNKKFVEILKDEMKDISLNVFTNIVGKQKNLALLTDKLVNVLRQYIATPQIRQDPEMTKLLNTILESSGLSPIMFGPAPQMAQPGAQPGAPAGSTQPLQDLAQTNEQPV